MIFDCLALRALAGAVLLVAGHGPGGQGQEMPATTPGLTSAEVMIDLPIEPAMKRAHDALVAAGLKLHKPMPTTIGANNEWVFALINVDAKEGKTRVTTSVASNPGRRGESYSTCMFLIEFMKTGKANKAAINSLVVGVWEVKVNGHAGPFTARMTVKGDGTVTADGTSDVGSWWTEGKQLFIWWPSGGQPKTNMHYVITYAVADDGRSMRSDKGNYYQISSEAKRIGDLQLPAGGGETSAGAGSSGSSGAGTDWLPAGALADLSGPRFAPGPLPLPPVGAESGAVKQTEPEDGPLRGPAAEQDPIRLTKLAVTHIEGSGRGQLQVDVEVDKPHKDYVVDIYVGGYLVRAVQPEGLNAPVVGHAPAYQYTRVPWGHPVSNQHPDNKGPYYRWRFPVPDVLPTSVRVELYHVTAFAPAKLIGTKEAQFTVPGWRDYSVKKGFLKGDRGEGAISACGMLVDDGVTSGAVGIPKEGNLLNGHIVAFTFRERPDMVKNGAWYIGTAMDLKYVDTLIAAPSDDLDLRNNHFWPNLPNKGYYERPPVLIGR